MENNEVHGRVIYRNSDDNQYRYALGIKGEKTLYCIGINPNTATPENYDQTMKKLRKAANLYGFDSFVMFNIYPLRAATPDKLPKTVNWSEHNENVKIILDLIKDGSTIWAAWGNSINSRPWLDNCLADITNNIKKTKKKIKWVKMGKLTNKQHPRHPSRLRYQEFSPFTLKP